MCPPMRAHWRIRLNLCILRPTRVHNPNGKSIGSAVFARLTAESAYTLQRAPLSTRIAPFYGGPRPHLTHYSLGLCEPKTQTAPRSDRIGSAVFAQMTTDCPYIVQWFARFPLNIAPSYGGIWTSCNTWSQSQAAERNGIWSRTGLRPASELDSVMEFGLRHAHDMHTQVFAQLASSSRTTSRTSSRADRKLDSVTEFRKLVCDLLASWTA